MLFHLPLDTGAFSRLRQVRINFCLRVLLDRLKKLAHIGNFSLFFVHCVFVLLNQGLLGSGRASAIFLRLLGLYRGSRSLLLLRERFNLLSEALYLVSLRPILLLRFLGPLFLSIIGAFLGHFDELGSSQSSRLDILLVRCATTRLPILGSIALLAPLLLDLLLNRLLHHHVD